MFFGGYMKINNVFIFVCLVGLGSFNKVAATLFDRKKYHKVIYSFLCDDNMKFTNQDGHDSVMRLLEEMFFNLNQPEHVDISRMKSYSIQLFVFLGTINGELTKRQKQPEGLSAEEQNMFDNCNKIFPVSCELMNVFYPKKI